MTALIWLSIGASLAFAVVTAFCACATGGASGEERPVRVVKARGGIVDRVV